MVTEEQKKLFNGKLGVVLNIENINISDENRKKHITWLKNVYYKYLNNTLPEEHKKDLENNLQRRNISHEEFLETKGNLDMFITLYKSKEEPKQETIEELEKLQNELAKLSKKHTPKGKNLYRLTDEEYNEIGKQISELEEKIKEISKKLSEKTPKEEIKEEKVTSNAQKKIEELIVTNKQKDAEIVELKNELAKQREERAFYSNKYREEAERELEIHKKQLEDEFNKKCDKIVRDKVREKIIKNTEKENETTTLKKYAIKNLMLSKGIVTLEEIDFKLKNMGISTDKLDVVINELRNEIPGITKVLDENGEFRSYSLSKNAKDRLENLKKDKICLTLSNVYTGEVKFILRADMHLTENSLDVLKSHFDPYYNFSAANDNIPIIDLGDIGNHPKKTRKELWEVQDKKVTSFLYTFYQNYAKALAMAPKTMHYTEFGNHDEDAYLLGIDPIEIILNNCDNFKFLGINESAIKIGNDKIGLYHKIETPEMPKINIKKHRDFARLIHEDKNLANSIFKDYIYCLIGHYHIGAHNPLLGFSMIKNGVENPLLVSVEVNEGNIERITIQKLTKGFKCNDYETEVYNSSMQYKKKKSH